MRWFRFATLILITTILQAGIVDIFAISPMNIKPDLLLILVVFFCIYSTTNEAIIASFSIGFAADLIGPTMGPQIISFGLIGTLLAYLNNVITIRKMPYQTFTIFIIAFSTSIVTILLRSIKGLPSVPNMYSLLFGTSLYSALFGPFLFLPSAWWMQMAKTHRFTRS